MGKCESVETSMNDFSDIRGIVGRFCETPTGWRLAQTPLQPIQRAQIITRLIEAATAKRCNESAAILQPFGVDPPLAPRKKIVGERKRIRIFIVEHDRGLIRVPPMLRSEHSRAEHV